MDDMGFKGGVGHCSHSLYQHKVPSHSHVVSCHHPSCSKSAYPILSQILSNLRSFPYIISKSTLLPLAPPRSYPPPISLTHPTSITLSVGSPKFAIFVCILSLRNKNACNNPV